MDEREKASVPCELAAAASARSANVKIAPPCVRAPALRCSGFISNLAVTFAYFQQYYSCIFGKQVVLKKLLCGHDIIFEDSLIVSYFFNEWIYTLSFSIE